MLNKGSVYLILAVTLTGRYRYLPFADRETETWNFKSSAQDGLVASEWRSTDPLPQPVCAFLCTSPKSSLTFEISVSFSSLLCKWSHLLTPAKLCILYSTFSHVPLSGASADPVRRVVPLVTQLGVWRERPLRPTRSPKPLTGVTCEPEKPPEACVSGRGGGERKRKKRKRYGCSSEPLRNDVNPSRRNCWSPAWSGGREFSRPMMRTGPRPLPPGASELHLSLQFKWNSLSPLPITVSMDRRCSVMICWVDERVYKRIIWWA